MLTLGLAMGAVTLGAVFYMYGRDLPSIEVLQQYTPRTISRVYSAEGRIIDEFATERRLFTPSEEIPDLVKHAFVSAEDQNFYTHPGYDVSGMVAAVVEAVRSRGEDVRGASTITQQVAKNFLLNGNKSIDRKVQEIILAGRIEQALGKEDILELYLNEIDLGKQSFGVTSAALTYFNKPLTELSPGEAAYLAALPKAPYGYDSVSNYDAALERRNYVLRRMFEDGYIDQPAYEAERDAPLLTVQRGDYPSFRATLPPRDYFTDEIRRQLSDSFGDEQFASGGYAIRATMDPELQVEAAHALQRALESFDRGLGEWHGTLATLPAEALADESTWRQALAEVEAPRDVTLGGTWYPAVVLEIADQQMRLGIEGEHAEEPVVPRADIDWIPGNFDDNFDRGDVVLVRQMLGDDGGFQRWTLRQVPEVQGAFMAMDVNTGRVLAMQGGFSYQSSVFNRATQARRQPGSAFKPFVYAAALDSGYTPATVVVDAPIEIDTPEGLWQPQNSSGEYYGPTPLRTGIEQSRNLMTIRLAQEIGMETVAEYAERFGVYDDMTPYLSNALGSQETTLFRMVAAYAMFANGGERVEPTLVDRVQDRYGDTIYRHDQRDCVDCADLNLPQGEAPHIESNRSRIMNAVTAYELTSMLEGVVQRGTAAKAIDLPVPIAGKTGTTNEAKDVWFIGFSSNIVAGCYIGYDTPRSMGGASGGGVCAPVFQEFMEPVVARLGGGPFAVPDGCSFLKIDRFSGERLPDDAEGDNVVSECFRTGEEPIFGVTFDGGFEVSGDLPLVEEVRAASRNVTTATGGTATVSDGNASFGTISSGGLY